MKKEGKGTDIIITTIKKKRRRNKRKRHCMEITLPQVVVFSQKEKKEHFLSIKISVFFFCCFSYECSLLLFTLIHLPTPPLSPPSLPPWNPPGKQIQMRSHAKKPKKKQQPKTKQQKNIKRPKSKQKKKKSKKAKSSKKVSRRRWRRRRRTRLWSGELGKDIRKNNDGGGGGGRWHFFFGGYFLFVCFCLKFCVFFDTTETC